MRIPRLITALALACALPLTAAAQGMRGGAGAGNNKTEEKLPSNLVQPTAWTASYPLGLRVPAPVDTLELGFYRRFVPSEVTDAWACTGNYGAEGKDMLYMQQQPIGEFFLTDAFSAWMPLQSRQLYFNSGVPMTQVAYTTGGGREAGQDRLQAVFSGNFNRRAQLGANVDYLYSKGSYENQAAKHLCWGLSGSYMGDRYEFQGSWNHYNSLNKENGGITDDLYILDPAKLQGGIPNINPKSIPTRLSKAHTRIVGGELYLNNRYKVGYWHEVTEGDSVVSREYIPVTSFFWTLGYRQGRHRFDDLSQNEIDKFFGGVAYLDRQQTEDLTSYWALSNTVGVSLLEGFNKYAKFGLAAFLTYETRRYTQTPDSLDHSLAETLGLTPLPQGVGDIAPRGTQNLAWVGGQLTKTRGSILRYEAIGEIGVMGDAAGEVKLRGNLSTRIPLLGDTVSVTGYGRLLNVSPPYLLQQYVSNHFVWHNDFSKERRVRFGGAIDVPWTLTNISAGVENVQNMLYFDDLALPAQCGSSIQVFSATLDQRLRLGILHWDNRVTYQRSSNTDVLPLPELTVYSNLYINCRIATLHLQLGVDCDYYTSYYAPAFQPATATFHNQHEMKLGNYPFVNAYANMKLGRTRFYVMMTHLNQGWLGGNRYFSSPHYPLNPMRLQMGLCVDFIN